MQRTPHKCSFDEREGGCPVCLDDELRAARMAAGVDICSICLFPLNACVCPEAIVRRAGMPLSKVPHL